MLRYLRPPWVCAQIGRTFHLSGAVGSRPAVLEPDAGRPTSIEGQSVLHPARAPRLVDGLHHPERLGAGHGRQLTSSSIPPKIGTAETGAVTYGEVPPYSVVVSGSMPSSNGVNLYCAVIVKRVDEKTRSKVGINELLRD